MSTKENRYNIAATAAGIATGMFVMGFAAGVVTDAYFTPDHMTVIDDIQHSSEIYAPYEWQDAEAYDEGGQIEFALFQQATDWEEFEATGYCNCEICCGKWAKYHSTYTGATPQEGVTIAVDPDVIPLYSQVFVQMPNDDSDVWHCYTAQDIGGAIKGNRIDIYFENHEDALAFGRKKVLLSYTAP